MKHHINLILGGSLLVTGTCIGGGMVGLPVKSAALGFYPTVGVFIVVWLLMNFSALCMLEVSMYVKGETNLIGMASKTLGKWGKNFAWFFYIAFLYSVMASYTAGGSTLVASFLGYDITSTFDVILVAGLFVGLFGLIVYFGAKTVDYFNRILIIGLLISYILLLAFVDGDKNLLSQNSFGDTKYILYALPLMVTSFGYHLLIPTLKYYLKEDIKALRLAIIIGGLIPLFVYIFWEFEVFHLIPISGPDGLLSMLNSPENPAELIIKKATNASSIAMLTIGAFSFFALVSSFVGVGLGIMDFLADGIKVRKNHKGKLFLALLTFLPPALFTIIVPGGFLLALGYAGIFASILLVIYPVAMAWYGRYIKKIKSPYTVSGGKFLLIIAFLFGLVVILSEVLEQFGVLPTPV